MLFNSLEFLAFFPLVTIAYYALPHPRRWVLLLAASCAFYMRFVPVYILILLATILIDYFAGIWIEETSDPVKKRRYLVLSIVSVCLVLFAFKYFNFFNEQAAAISNALGWNYPIGTLEILLPIGLSFHTFQSLSYVIEVYRGRQPAERHFGIYALYVMYFPQLVAGPIERPQKLLPQLKRESHLEHDRVVSGLKLMLWGMFKKVVIADRLAVFVNLIYAHPGDFNGSTLLLATYLFAVQIYCDFSGYTDIAIGVSRLLGHDLAQNFNLPYFATSISDFWTRWHMSLSTWFKDYVYFPLGGNRVPQSRWMFNILVTFLISGLWHGANWTFIIWGALHGSYYIVGRSTKPARDWLVKALRIPDGVRHVAAVIFTFHLVTLAWVLFRSANVHDAFTIITRIVTRLTPLVYLGPSEVSTVLALLLIGVLFAVQLLQHFGWAPHYGSRARMPNRAQWAACVSLVLAILVFGVSSNAFIYFQF